MYKNKRFERINEELKKLISKIVSYELQNPKITGMVTVTKVEITEDLKYAKIFVSLLNSKDKKETLAGLKASSGYIRSSIAKEINLRITPELKFELDESIEYGSKIDKILSEILPNKTKEK